jgi:large subunit ribosomal protein L5
MARLRDRYKQEILPQLVQEFKFKNVLQAPHITKVVVNVGVGEA